MMYPTPSPTDVHYDDDDVEWNILMGFDNGAVRTAHVRMHARCPCSE